MSTLKEKCIARFNSRIHEIDLFRGFLIMLVVFDHLMWFINFYIFKNTSGFLNWYWTSELRYVVRQIVLCLFLFTCGVSCHLSRNNSKRGLLLLALAILVTIGTHILQVLPLLNDRVVAIDINILGVIAISILLYALCQRLDFKGLLFVTGVLIVFYFFIQISIKQDPSLDYNPILSILYCPFNPIKEGYVGDYLPLFPYIIFLFFGVMFARIVYQNKQSVISKKGRWERPICLLGRHTLIIYVLHEIIFTGIFMLIALFIK